MTARGMIGGAPAGQTFHGAAMMGTAKGPERGVTGAAPVATAAVSRVGKVDWRNMNGGGFRSLRWKRGVSGSLRRESGLVRLRVK